MDKVNTINKGIAPNYAFPFKCNKYTNLGRLTYLVI